MYSNMNYKSNGNRSISLPFSNGCVHSFIYGHFALIVLLHLIWVSICLFMFICYQLIMWSYSLLNCRIKLNVPMLCRTHHIGKRHRHRMYNAPLVRIMIVRHEWYDVLEFCANLPYYTRTHIGSQLSRSQLIRMHI